MTPIGTFSPSNPTGVLSSPTDVTKPYYFNPAPATLSPGDRSQLRSYQNQLYWQQRKLEQTRPNGLLTPDEQRRIEETEREADRVNSLLAPSLRAPAVVLPPPQLRVGPSPQIPPK